MIKQYTVYHENKVSFLLFVSVDQNNLSFVIKFGVDFLNESLLFSSILFVSVFFSIFFFLFCKRFFFYDFIRIGLLEERPPHKARLHVS